MQSRAHWHIRSVFDALVRHLRRYFELLTQPPQHRRAVTPPRPIPRAGGPRKTSSRHQQFRSNATLAAVALSLSFAALAQSPQPAAPHSGPVAQLGWLVGGVWVADASGFGGGMQRIRDPLPLVRQRQLRPVHHPFRQRQQRRAEHLRRQFLLERGRENVHDVVHERWRRDHRRTGDDQQRRAEMLFRGTDFDGKLADLRVDVTKKTPDLYRWTLLEKQGDAWKQLASLDYARKPEA